MPTILPPTHLQFLYDELKAFVKPGKLGSSVTSGYKVRLRSGKDRDRTSCFIKTKHVRDRRTSVSG